MADRPIIFSSVMVQALLAGQKAQTRRLLRSPMPAPPSMDAIHPSNIGSKLRPAPYFDAYCFDAFRNKSQTAANPRGMSDQWCWWTRDDRQCLPTIRVGYVPGDRLWVREAWAPHPDGVMAHGAVYRLCHESAAQTGPGIERWRPSIHMPRWASRLTLSVTDVRVQRLQEISEADAQAEGVAPFVWVDRPLDAPHRYNFQLLWNDLHGPGAWEADPHVVALTFSVEQRNIDAL
jgi:hypothetical protein